MAEYKKFKYYYNKDLAEFLAQKIENHYHEFKSNEFIKKISSQVNDLELKARVEVFADNLLVFLPDNYSEALNILLKILGPEIENETGMFKDGYWLMPIAYFVEKYGLEDFDTSVAAIHEITKRHTGEYAVRPYLERYPVEMLEVMKKWSTDKSVHVRRLSSEGVRPRLPWARKLNQYIDDPALIMPILENLIEDDSKFVQKSVANCMNDILKDNYSFAIKILKNWGNSKVKNTCWIVKHALRNEIKKSNPEALEIISWSN